MPTVRPTATCAFTGKWTMIWLNTSPSLSASRKNLWKPFWVVFRRWQTLPQTTASSKSWTRCLNFLGVLTHWCSSWQVASNTLKMPLKRARKVGCSFPLSWKRTALFPTSRCFEACAIASMRKPLAWCAECRDGNPEWKTASQPACHIRFPSCLSLRKWIIKTKPQWKRFS